MSQVYSTRSRSQSPPHSRGEVASGSGDGGEVASGSGDGGEGFLMW